MWGPSLAPMATPLICLCVCALNSKKLWFNINFNMVFITCGGGGGGGMGGCMVDCMYHRVAISIPSCWGMNS